VRAGEVAAVTLLEALAPPGTVGARGRALLRKDVPNTRGEAAAFLEGDFGGIPSLHREEGASGAGGEGVPLPELEGGEAHLPPGLRALARMVAAQGARDRPGLEREMGSVVLAVRRGELSGQKVEEALLQSYLFLGYPAALEALALWRQVGSEQVEGVVNERPGSWEVRGPRVLARVYGAQEAGLRRNIGALHPDMARWMVLEGYGKVLGRPGLDLGRRELCIVAILAVLDTPVQLYSHLRGALNVGVPQGRVEATLEQALALAPSRGAAARARDTWARLLRRRHGG
jgi:4-carboxymuconolactone decarboxylase